MTDPYLTILARAKVDAKTDARTIRRLRFELGQCKSLVGRYRKYFSDTIKTQKLRGGKWGNRGR